MRRPLVRVLVPSLLAVLATLSLAVPRAAARNEWITAEAGGFEVFSNAGEKPARRILQDLVDFRQTLLSFMKLPPGFEPRCTVVVFADDEEFKRYKPLYNGKPKEVAGFFTGGNDQVMIALTTGREEAETRRLVFHEYMHQLLFCRGLVLPVWLNEGLAEYFSTFAVKKNRVVLGSAIENHVRFLNHVTTMSLAELFAIRQDSADYNEGIRQGIFYAESWALVHYLLSGHNPEYARALNRYLEVLRTTGLDQAPNFADIAGIGPAKLERELLGYLRTGRYHLYEFKDTVNGALAPTAFQPAGAADVECVLQQLRWLAQRDPRCNLELLNLAKRMPDSPRSYEALGGIAARSDEPEQALEYWGRAAERGSRNAFLHVQLVRVQVEPFVKNGDVDYRLPDDRCDELRRPLLRALELAPDYGDALSLLAVVEAFSQHMNPANINLVQRDAGKIRDPRLSYAAMALIRWRVKDYETCRKLVNVVLSGPEEHFPILNLARELDRRLQQKSSGG